MDIEDPIVDEAPASPVGQLKARGESSIFDMNPEIRQETRKVVQIGIAGEIIASIFVIIACNLLFTFAWNPASITIDNFDVAVLNRDGTGPVGQAFMSIAAKHTALNLNYKFHFLPNSTTASDLRNLVDDGTYYAGVVVNEGTSQTLLAALPTSSSVVYTPASALTLFYDQTRCGVSYSIAMVSLGNTLASATRATISRLLMTQFSSYNVTSFKTSLMTAPVAITPMNLHPVAAQGIQTALGLSFMQVYLVILIHSIIVIKLQEDLQSERILHSHVVYFMSTHRLLGALLLSIWPGIVLLCLGAGDILMGGNFFIFWMFMWLCMTTFGSLNHHIYDMFGPGIGMVVMLISCIIQLVSCGGLAPYEAMPDFFQIGKGLPLKAAVEGAKAILLGSLTDRLPTNIGILFGW